jgi:Heparinase II/III-like protein/Heparinase II/III N-terminus
MTAFLTRARAAFGLGLINIAHAVGYRMGIKLGLSSLRRLKANTSKGPFFLPAQHLSAVGAPAVTGWQFSALLFSCWPYVLSYEPPDWLFNPFTGQRVAAPERDWWQIPDFSPDVGDIKLIWELSRMDWVLAFAQRARQGDQASLDKLNTWLADWCDHNPPYKGPNWKCGQEASIRVMHLAMAALILCQVHQPAPGLLALLRVHLQRIVPTIKYAMAQDNNHGTSEATALFIGGSWLAAQGVAEGERWVRMGRRWLENRAGRLIGSQGSFSQYSLNYHRVMLDTFCMAEVWRRYLALPAFSADLQAKTLAATQWLRHMVNSENGDAPNVGANDGARLLQLTDTAYRDYRPTVQLATALFANQRAYEQPGTWDHALRWLGVAMPQHTASEPGHYIADDGGFSILRRGLVMAMLRYPRFRFRPSQADALHLDLWLNGENLLRDGGTYSYNTDPQCLNYFGGTASHNTVQFDGQDQMPRLSRFLFGDWLKTKRLYCLHEDAQAVNFGAGYCDRQDRSHMRRISLGDTHLRVEDEVGGFKEKAVLRWRLSPGDWHLEYTPHGARLTRDGQGDVTLTVAFSNSICRCELANGWESRHYLEKKLLPVLEVEIRHPGVLTTEIDWTV